FAKAGEFHAWDPRADRAMQKDVPTGDVEAVRQFRQLSSMGEPGALRDLLGLRPASLPVALEEVEPAEQIRRRFISTAMSLGALSPEAHQALAVALNRMGGRSNSGEGGEDPDTY